MELHYQPYGRGMTTDPLISRRTLRAITRIATAENEQDLLYIAENGTAEHLEKTHSRNIFS